MPPSVASTLRPHEREWVDERYGWDSAFESYSLATVPPAGDLRLAQQIVAEACAPADENTLQRELARLRVSTKSRDLDADEIAMTLQVIAEEAIEYPADVAIAAMRRWARRETFFPSLAEIRDEMQRLGKRRLALQASLDDPQKPPPEELREAARRALAEAEAKRDEWRKEWKATFASAKRAEQLLGPWPAVHEGAPPPPQKPLASYPDDPT